MSQPLKLAFPLIGHGGSMGATVYLMNTLALVKSRLASEIEAWVFLTPEENEEYGAELAALTDGRVLVDPCVPARAFGFHVVKALATGRNTALEQLLIGAGIDVVFECAGFSGSQFSIPTISWMPDFQHRLMPQMFGSLEWWRRDIGFRIQLAAGRTIMLSSGSAQTDFERFYPASRGKSHVVRFAIPLDIPRCLGRGAEMRAQYELPETYFFLPNTFWRHKNHIVIVDALATIAAKTGLDAFPPVVLTGSPKDYRHPAHFQELQQRAKDLGVDSHFRYIGMLPYDHILSLNADCHALINPSYFEGWSTPVEEAKAFATPLVLSDLPIHREQAPTARFFNPDSPQEAAAALMDAAAAPPRDYAPVEELVAEQNERLDDHAQALLGVVRVAASTHHR